MSPPVSRLTRRRLSPAAAACAGLLVAGCATLGRRTALPAAIPLPAEIAAYYDYPNHAPEAVQLPLESTPQIRLSLVRFQLSHPADLTPTEPVVELEWFESTRPGRRPAVLLNPILGGDYPLEREIARFFASRGVHVALVHRKTLKISPEHELAHMELLLRQGILRIRQTVDWMSRHPAVDPARLASFGISMGGIAGAMTAAVEPRLSAHVIGLAGGPIADVLSRTRDRLLTKPRDAYLARHGLTVEAMRERLAATIRTDPIALAPYAQGRPMLLFITRFDRTVGRRRQLALWRALGRPRAVVIPLGHYTSYAALPYIKRAGLRFLRRTWGR